LPEKNVRVFSVTIPPNTPEYEVVFETLLTTANVGGQVHSFKVE
jgi:hypothetical protein